MKMEVARFVCHLTLSHLVALEIVPPSTPAGLKHEVTH